MATFTRKFKTVTKFIEQKTEVPDGLTLHLDDAEAKAIAAVLTHVGGSPRGWRGSIDQINRALREGGYMGLEICKEYEPLAKDTGSIYFKEGK